MKYENNNEILANADGIELGDEMLEQVVGGRPRIHLGGPKRNPLKAITEVYQTVRKIVKAIGEKVAPKRKDPGPNPNIPLDTVIMGEPAEA